MAQHQKGIFNEYVDDDEMLLGMIHKHPFGIVIVYVQAIFGIVVSLVLAVILLPRLVSQAAALSIVSVFGFFSAFLGLIIMIAATIIYRQSRIVITDKNITQVLQGGLFNRKVSQLTMANVEDVTAIQHGIFATLFDFGELRVETAGEQENFVFTFCPRPGYYAKIILEAREKYISHEYPYAEAYQGQMAAQRQMPQNQPPVAAEPPQQGQSGPQN